MSDQTDKEEEHDDLPFWPVALICLGLYAAIIYGISLSGIRVVS